MRHVLVWFVLFLAVIRPAGSEETPPLPFPDMAPSVGQVLSANYYDKARFRPRLMVERALRYVELAEVGIDTTWPEGKILINLRGEGDRLKIAAPEPTDVTSALRLIEDIRIAIDGAFDAPQKRLRLLDYALVNGALSTLDPHTVLWPPEAAREFDEEAIKGQFYGIGAFLNQEQGLVSIQRVMPGLPAERAGVEDGDVILAIDGEKSAGLTLEQAVRRIKGPKGTTVSLTMERKGLKTPIDIPIVRDLVKLIAMQHVRDGDVGYIRMDDFTANTAHDLYQALRDLEVETPIKALVLDLRFNGGGLLDQAKLIGGFFLGRKQEIVRITTIDGKEETTVNSMRERLVTAPVVVLVSPGTASAAEIVSGALQLNDRALIAGEATFGKGSVQNIHEMPDNSRLKLTIQEYLLPGGVSIQDTGVIPDLRLARHGVRQDGSITLCDMSYERERDHEFALGSHNNYRHDISSELSWLDPWLDKEARRRHTIAAKDFIPDRESQLMINLLKEACVAEDWVIASAKALVTDKTRHFLLDRLKAPIAKHAEVEAAALADALGRLPQPVRWGPPGSAGKKQLTLTWTGPAEVVAGERVALSIQVKNNGEAEVGRLYAIVRADARSPFWEDEFIVGAVAANSSASGTRLTLVPPRLPDGEERFSIELFQDGIKEALTSTPVVLRIKSRPAPHLGVKWHIEEPSGDGVLSPAEEGDLRIELFNDGTGQFDAGAVWLDKDNDRYVSLVRSRIQIDKPILPGGSVSLSFPFTVRKELLRGKVPVAFTDNKIAIHINVIETFADDVDARFRASFRATAEIPVGKPLVAHHLVQPKVNFVGAQPDNSRVRIRFQIVDQADPSGVLDEHASALKQVALFQDDDKIDLQPARALAGEKSGPWDYEHRVTAKPGLNRFRLVVSDSDGLTVEHHVRLWGQSIDTSAARQLREVRPEAQPSGIAP